MSHVSLQRGVRPVAPGTKTSLFVALLDSSPVVASPPSDQPGPPGWLPRDSHALAGHVHQTIALSAAQRSWVGHHCIWEDSWYSRLTATPRDRSGREAQSTSGVPSST